LHLLGLTRAAALVACCALIAAGCGSSGSSSTSSTTPTGDALGRLPTAPAPTGAPPSLSGSSASDVRTYLRTVFDDAQGHWDREFRSAGQA
jgi:hypothetical protein